MKINMFYKHHSGHYAKEPASEVQKCPWRTHSLIRQTCYKATTMCLNSDKHWHSRERKDKVGEATYQKHVQLIHALGDYYCIRTSESWEWDSDCGTRDKEK